jgi:CubicO group peptidase (beta-lactamase class C family)
MKKIILIILLSPILLSAQKNYPILFDDYMQAQVKVNEFTGTVLVAKKGEIIYEKAFGMADRELKSPNTVLTKFEIGSITKQFTASCILQLVSEGKLTLQDKLVKYFPDFPKADSVTIHMLLSHTSGIKNYTELPEFGKTASLPLEKDTMVALIKKQPFDFSPGTNFHYSNSNYYLLGYIVEKVTGKSYSDYVLTNVIQRAGLKNTSVNRWDSVLANRAKGYEKTSAGWKNAVYISMEAPYSAGAIISTIEDLYYWNNALFSNKIVSPELFTKMTTPYMEHYGYGLGIDTFQHHLRISHEGGIPGFVSYLARFPADDVIVAGLSNNQSANIEYIANALVSIFFNIPVMTPYKHQEVKIDPLLLNLYAGAYRFQDSPDADTLIVKEGKFYWHPPWATQLFLMKAESNSKFFSEDIPDTIFEFELDKNRKVVKADFIVSGTKYEMKKL